MRLSRQSREPMGSCRRGGDVLGCCSQGYVSSREAPAVSVTSAEQVKQHEPRNKSATEYPPSHMSSEQPTARACRRSFIAFTVA